MTSAAAPSTHSLTWDDIHRDGRALARLLMDRGPFARIVAVARGGLVPAAILARELGIRRVETLAIASYDDRTRGAPIILAAPGPLAADGGPAGAATLVVDDLVDTGATARVIRELLPGAVFATLYAKPLGHPLVDDTITLFSQDTWLLFPWDTAPQFVPPLAGQP
jgi:xanthine phosphoribosyltransferase